MGIRKLARSESECSVFDTKLVTGGQPVPLVEYKIMNFRMPAYNQVVSLELYARVSFVWIEHMENFCETVWC
jgi:hypothetical protein